MKTTFSIERLLSEYNENNSKNSLLTDYLNQKNIFQMIGKERSETVHSKFLSELLAGCYLHCESTESSAMHFFDILLKRSTMQGKDGDICKLKKAILTRKLKINDIEVKTEYTISKYIEDNSLATEKRCNPVEGEMDIFRQDPIAFYIRRQFKNLCNHAQFSKLVDNVKKSKLDIYMKMQVEMGGKRTIEIFVENKVGCKQNDFKLDKDTIVKQTDKYYNVCSKSENAGQGNRALQLFVYLSPMSKRELNAATVESVNDHFIQINYQDILNMVIEPLLNDNAISDRDRMKLAEYVNCLELPSLPDTDDVADNQSVKAMSIMATSKQEQHLIENFLKDPINGALIEATIGSQLMNKDTQFYSYKDHRMLSFDSVIVKALGDLISSCSELDVLSKMDVIEKRGGYKDEYSPFLMYCPTSPEKGFIPYELYVYDSKVYNTVTDALYQAFENCWATDVKCGDFQIFDVRRKGTTTSAFGESGIEMSFGKFLKKNIGPERLPKINKEFQRIYAHSQAPQIEKIDAERFHTYLSSCKDGMQKVALSKTNAYSRVGQSNFYYRNDVEYLADKIIAALPEIKIETLPKEDRELLDNFYVNNRKFILSVYKILMENCTDIKVYEYRKKCFNKLCLA